MTFLYLFACWSLYFYLVGHNISIGEDIAIPLFCLRLERLYIVIEFLVNIVNMVPKFFLCYFLPQEIICDIFSNFLSLRVISPVDMAMTNHEKGPLF
jgi:hypothetical protein